MATQTTELAYPVLDSQGTYDLIEANVAAANRSGDLSTDLKKALIVLLDLPGTDYSLDDLWKRYQLSDVVASDPDTVSAGKPPSRTPPEHAGQHPKNFLPPGRLRNAGGTGGFRGGSNIPAGAPNPSWSNVVAQCNFEGGTENAQVGTTERDQDAANSLEWVGYNTTDYVSTTSYFGSWSVEATNSIEFLYLPEGGTPTSNVGTQDWVMEIAGRFLADEDNVIFALDLSGTQKALKAWYDSSEQELVVEQSADGSTMTEYRFAWTGFAITTWFMFAFGRSSSGVWAAVDGQHLGFVADSAVDVYDAVPLRLWIGDTADTVSTPATSRAWWDAVRFTIGETHITGDYTLPTSYYPVQGPDELVFANVGLQLPFDGVDEATTTSDVSSNAHTVTLNTLGTKLDDGQVKFGSTSCFFNGVAGQGKVSVPADASMQLTHANGFTIEGWFWCNAIGVGQTIMAQWTWATGTGRSWVWYLNAAGGSQMWYDNGPTQQYNSAGWVMPTNQWVHLVAQSNTHTGKLEFFANGECIKRAAPSIGGPKTGTVDVTVGSSANDLNAWDGWVDSVRITPGLCLYNGEGFTPPTAPPPLS